MFCVDFEKEGNILIFYHSVKLFCFKFLTLSKVIFISVVLIKY